MRRRTLIVLAVIFGMSFCGGEPGEESGGSCEACGTGIPCVAGSCLTMEGYSGFTGQDNGDETVTDTSTGLMWQKTQSVSQMFYDDAAQFCDGLNLGGNDDWRLPAIDELRSLVKGCQALELDGDCPIYTNCGEACVDQGMNGWDSDGGEGSCFCEESAGPGIDGAYLSESFGEAGAAWSSTSLPGQDAMAAKLHFGGGYIRWDGKAGDDQYVRCVR